MLLCASRFTLAWSTVPIADRDQGEANEYERHPEDEDDHQEDGVRLGLVHNLRYAASSVGVRGGYTVYILYYEYILILISYDLKSIPSKKSSFTIYKYSFVVKILIR